MIRQFLARENFWNNGLLIIRIFSGIIITKYGLQVFESDAVQGYTQWLTDIHFPFPRFMVYLGKLAELIGGICLILGLFTRLVAIPLIITMATIIFLMGKGKILSDDEHPFLLLLLFLNFFILGSGKWSLDYLLFKGKKAILLLLLLLPSSVFSQAKEPWIQKPQNEWPPIALINEVWYQNGERYVDPSFHYVATGFLIDTGKDTLAVTAKHTLWVAKTKTLKTVDINPILQKWFMHPKQNIQDSVIIDRLINADSSEYLQGSDITQRDWLVFSTRYVSPRIQPLKPRYTEVKAGEKIYFFACPYDTPNCIVREGKVIEVRGNKIIFSYPPDTPLGGASGSAIVDENGFLIGILGGFSVNRETGEQALYAISTHYLKKILNHEKPLNIPLITIGEALYPILRDEGIEEAIQKLESIKENPQSHFIYDFSGEGFNTLAEDLLEEGKTDWALLIGRLSLEENPWLASTYNLLGKIYLQKGDKAPALEYYKRSLELWPQNKEAKKALEELK